MLNMSLNQNYLKKILKLNKVKFHQVLQQLE